MCVCVFFLLNIWTWRPLTDRDYLYKCLIPFNRRFHMKFEESWPRDFRGKVVQKYARIDGQIYGRRTRQVIMIAILHTFYTF